MRCFRVFFLTILSTSLSWGISNIYTHKEPEAQREFTNVYQEETKINGRLNNFIVTGTTGTVIFTSGTVQGPWTINDLITKGPWVDVRWFGAKTDGTDASVGINAAIAASPVGSVIFIPPGTFHIAASITINKSLKFFGNYSKGSIITTDNNNIPAIILDASAADLYNVDIKDLTLTTSAPSTSTNTVGIRISGSFGLKRSTIENCYIAGMYNGIQVITASPGSTDDLTIIHNNIEGGLYGIYYTTIGTRLIVVGNSFIQGTVSGSTPTCAYITGANFGDMTWTSNQFYQQSTNSVCMQFISTAPNSYRDNISIIGNHFDGDITQPYIKGIFLRSSMIIGNTMAGRNNAISLDSNSVNNVIQHPNKGIGFKINEKVVIADGPDTYRSSFGGEPASNLGNGQVQFKTSQGGIDESFIIGSTVSYSDGISLNSVNDGNSINRGFEIRGSSIVLQAVGSGTGGGRIHLNGKTIVGNTGFTAPQGSFHVKTTDANSDQSFIVNVPVSWSDGIALSAINDVGSNNRGFEIRGSSVQISATVAGGVIKLNGGNTIVSNHMEVSGTTPSMGACGTSPSVVGKDNGGIITVGGGVVTSCAMNFASTWINAPACTIAGSTFITGQAASATTTVLTISGTATFAGDTVMYTCIGYE